MSCDEKRELPKAPPSRQPHKRAENEAENNAKTSLDSKKKKPNAREAKGLQRVTLCFAGMHGEGEVLTR